MNMMQDANVFLGQIIVGRVENGFGVVLEEADRASYQVIALMRTWIFRHLLALLHAHLLACPSHCSMAIELM